MLSLNNKRLVNKVLTPVNYHVICHSGQRKENKKTKSSLRYPALLILTSLLAVFLTGCGDDNGLTGPRG